MKVDVVSVLVFLFSAQVEAGVGGLIQVPGRDPQLSLQKSTLPVASSVPSVAFFFPWAREKRIMLACPRLQPIPEGRPCRLACCGWFKEEPEQPVSGGRL